MVSRLCTSAALVLVVFLTSFASQARSKIGVGIVLGDPTGFSFKYGLKTKNSVDGVFAVQPHFIHLHADYLWNHKNLFKVDSEAFHAFYGIGGRFRDLDKRKYSDDDDDSRLGVRGPAGIRWVASSIPLEVFLEIALIFDVVPETDASIDGGIGVRWFF